MRFWKRRWMMDVLRAVAPSPAERMAHIHRRWGKTLELLAR